MLSDAILQQGEVKLAMSALPPARSVFDRVHLELSAACRLEAAISASQHLFVLVLVCALDCVACQSVNQSSSLC